MLLLVVVRAVLGGAVLLILPLALLTVAMMIAPFD
jgi:hypothetical protein